MRSFRELAVGIPMHYTQKRVVPEAGVARLKPRRSTPSPLAASSLPDALLFVGGGSGSPPSRCTPRNGKREWCRRRGSNPHDLAATGF